MKTTTNAALVGTEKQIAWANEIRDGVIAKLEQLLESGGPRPAGADPEQPCPAEDLATLAACNSAAWWIAVSKSSPMVWDWAHNARRALRGGSTPRAMAFVARFGMPVV